MDGPRAICYYDTATRSIKISRNYTFNENDPPREWKIMTNLLALRSKWEQETVDALQIPTIANAS
jgi:hypothetical protein